MTDGTMQLSRNDGYRGALGSQGAGVSFKTERSCLLIADDLTGACDSGVQFALRGMTSTALLQAEETFFPRSQVLCITTNSRGDLKSDAKSKVRHAASALAPYKTKDTLRFKKIDSCLRGNVVAETEAMMQAFACKIALVAPAFPAMKRTVRNGILRTEDPSPETAISLVELFQREWRGSFLSLRNIPSYGGPQKLQEVIREALRNDVSLLLADSESDRDLYDLAAAASHFREDLLWVGSGGLAQAAARTLRPQSIETNVLHSRLQQSLIFLIGSNHASTEAQVDYFISHSNVEFVPIEFLEFPGVRKDAKHALQQGAPLLVRIDRGKTTNAAICTLWKTLGSEWTGGLFLCGGDTGTKVCEALGSTSIFLKGEISAGIPWGILSNGLADGVPVITKSGGFGETSCLSDIVAQLSRFKDAVYGS